MPALRGGTRRFYAHFILCLLLHWQLLGIKAGSIQQQQQQLQQHEEQQARFPFPLDDVSNETVDSDMDFVAPVEDYSDPGNIDDFNAPPPWIQPQQSHKFNKHHHNMPHNNNNHKSIKALYKPHHNHPTTMEPIHKTPHAKSCSIEITTRVPGNCMTMPHDGSACVSGEFMEIYSADCN